MRGRALTAVLLATSVLFLPGVAGAASKDDPATKRDEVRRQRADVAAKVDVLKADDTQVQKALDDLDTNVQATQAVVASAQQAADVAARQAGEAREKERRKAEELASIKRQMSRIAVDAYMSPLSGGLMSMLKSASLSDATMKREFLHLGVGRGAEIADQLRIIRADLEAERKKAESAQRRAADRRGQVERRLGELRAASDQQEQVASQVEGRINSGLAEAAALASVDQALSDQLARQQAALAAKVAAQTRAAAPAAPRGGGGVAAPTRAGPAPPVGAPVVARPSGNIALATVGGITVAASIAGQLGSLLNAARADGFTFGGSGYRDSSQQVALRRAHCGPTEYDIYQAPAGACSPPTAPPGTSMHEQGLAIDFTCNGALIGSRSSSCYQWLASHAGSYGFYNYPPEPWHWSVNGH